MSVRSPTAGTWSSSQWRPDNEFETDRFTGIDDPYEPPERPDIAIDTSDMQPEVAVRRVFSGIARLGYIR